jgi:hypothetical protein
MATLRLKNVPRIVIERLEESARAEGISVDALAVRALADATQRTPDTIVLDSRPETAVPKESDPAPTRRGHRR